MILIAVPGPSVLFVIGRSLALGWKGGVLTVLGNAAGQLVQVAAGPWALGIVVAQSVLLFSAVKLAGAAYLVYLGIKAIRHRRDHLSTERPPVDLIALPAQSGNRGQSGQPAQSGNRVSQKQRPEQPHPGK